MSDKLKEVIGRQKKQQEEPANKQVEDIIQLVGFYVGNEEFAVPILTIQEIIKPLEYTRVPSSPAYVLGVFNLRGSVIPLIDLKMKFGVGKFKQTEDTRFVVMKHEDEIAGFVIDRLTEAIRMKESQIDPPPETFTNAKMMYGIGKREDRILTILKVEGLLKRES